MWANRTSEPLPGGSSHGNSGRSGSGPEHGVQRSGAVMNVAVIGQGMIIRGQVTSKESLHIDGELEGSLQMSEGRLTVSRNGKLGANVTAREIELMGVVRGNLEASSKITIRKGARLIGDLRAPGIVIEEGAYVKGKIEIINSEPAQETLEQSVLQKAAAG